jgi:hypothetical protein
MRRILEERCIPDVPGGNRKGWNSVLEDGADDRAITASTDALAPIRTLFFCSLSLVSQSA